MEMLVRSDYTWPDLAPPSKAVHLLHSYEAIRGSLSVSPREAKDHSGGQTSKGCNQSFAAKFPPKRTGKGREGVVVQSVIDSHETSHNDIAAPSKQVSESINSLTNQRTSHLQRLPRPEMPPGRVRREIFPQVRNSDEIPSESPESRENFESAALPDRGEHDGPRNETPTECSGGAMAPSEEKHAQCTSRGQISSRASSLHIRENYAAESLVQSRRMRGDATTNLSSGICTTRSIPDPTCTTWSWNAGDATRRQHSCTVVTCNGPLAHGSRANGVRGPFRSSSTGMSRRRRWEWVENNPLNQEMRRQALERVRKRLEESRRRQIIKQQQQEQYEQEKKMRGMILSERLRQRTRERIQEYIIKKQEEQLQLEQMELEKRRQAEQQRLLCDMHRKRLQKRLAEQQRICKQAMRRQIEDSMKFSYDMKVRMSTRLLFSFCF